MLMVGLVVGMVVVVLWCESVRNKHYVNLGTYTRLVHEAVELTLDARRTSDVHIALRKLECARSQINTVVRVAGGEDQLRDLTGLDVEQVLNDITQQKQLVEEFTRK